MPHHVLTTDERLARFWDYVDKSGECWVWKGSAKSGGYGHFLVAPYQQRPAHQIAWELANGKPVSEGQIVCHHCDNPPCVRPEHLFVGTRADNVQDKVRKGRDKPRELYDHPEWLLPRQARAMLGMTESEFNRLRAYGYRLQSNYMSLFGSSFYHVDDVATLRQLLDAQWGNLW